MISGYHIWTVSHKTCDLNTVGQFVLDEDPAVRNKTLRRLKKTIGAEELLYVQTCNRIMYLAYSGKPIGKKEGAQRFFPDTTPLKRLGYYKGKQAVKHFFQVASSIDSMVIGEREITGQIKKYYRSCHSAGLTGDHIRLLKESAVVAAKEVFSSTRIGEKPVSVVSLAFEALCSGGMNRDSRILLIGAGDTIGLMCKFLKKYGHKNIAIFNRTLSKAEALAEQVNGVAYSLAELEEYDKGFDVLISCTATSSVLLNRRCINRLIAGEKQKKWIVDLAVPHDCDPDTPKMTSITYLHIEDLKKQAAKHMALRQKEVDKARTLLEEQLKCFETRHRQRQVVRALGDIPREIKNIRERALRDVFHSDLEDLDPETRSLVERMMHYMEKKCIGIPMKTAREAFSPSE